LKVFFRSTFDLDEDPDAMMVIACTKDETRAIVVGESLLLNRALDYVKTEVIRNALIQKMKEEKDVAVQEQSTKKEDSSQVP
jgi:hypothetical protein